MHGRTDSGKGDTYRHVDRPKWDATWARLENQTETDTQGIMYEAKENPTEQVQEQAVSVRKRQEV